MGIIIKDGTDLYNGFGIGFSQCISHIQRYLKRIYDFVEHTGSRKMENFLTKYNNYRKELIQREKKKFENSEYEKIIKETNISSATLSRVSKCVKYGSGYKKFCQ